MLEGLEVSILKLSELNLRNDRFRFDAEFAKKEYLIIEAKLESKDYKRLIDTDSKISHPSEIKREYVDDGEWFFRTQNLRPLKIENSNDVYISKEDAKTLLNNEIKYGDVLITRTGANFGQTAIYNKNVKAIGSSHVLILRNTFLNQSYLAVFLNTKYGRKMIDKGMYGAAQPEIAPYYLYNIPIPIFSEAFQLNIEKILKLSTLKEQDSINIYSQAETLLLETIGLNNFEPSKEAVNIKSFKESFLSTGRLDAEYYQKKYDDYISLIKAYSNGYDTLQKVCKLSDKNFNPEDNTKYNYIELADIGKSGEITGCTTALGNELPSRARRKVFTNDVVISSIEGSLNSCAMVTEEYNNALCSTGFYVINSDKINSETLLVLFKSEPMQNILKQNCSGTILTAINKTEFQNIPVPIIDYSIQEKIAALVEESFKLKKQSEQLLETAKRAVEVAIEDGEEKGMEVMNNKYD